MNVPGHRLGSGPKKIVVLLNFQRLILKKLPLNTETLAAVLMRESTHSAFSPGVIPGFNILKRKSVETDAGPVIGFILPTCCMTAKHMNVKKQPTDLLLHALKAD